MKDFNLKKYLAEGKLLKEEEFKLYTTNVEYDNGKTGYMYQLVNSEDREENEIGFDQLYFDDNNNRLKLGVDFNDFNQTSYQEEEVSKEEALKMYSELLSENKLLKEEQMGSYTKFLKVIKSYEDEEILKDFLDSYPKGQDISKSEYDKFTEKHFGLADPEDYRGKNWKYIMSENKLLKEDQMMGKYIQTQHPDGYDMIMSFSMPDEGELGLDYGTLDEILEVKEINGVKVYCVYI